MATDLLPRFARARLEQALADTPVVLVHGPRQCGKTTLAQQVGAELGHQYFSFDDDLVLASARSDPLGFVADLPDRAVLDEVQKAPSLFASLKLAIDRKRTAGRFILTGSANVLLVPTLSDSLAGRMEVVRLHPMSQCELAKKPSRFLDKLFAGEFSTMVRVDRLGAELHRRIVDGGFPAALARVSAGRRQSWYRHYTETLVQRDVRDLSRIHSFDVLPRLLAVAAAQTARLLNASDLAAPFQVSRPTIRDYITLLERVFLIDLLPPWHSNRLSRLVKTPKLHMGDTGVAAELLRLDAAGLAKDRNALGQLFESFVFQELRRHSSWHDESITFHHFRDRDGAEVDVVLERSGHEIAGIEVKASATVTAADFRGLRKLQEAAPQRFTCGVVVYDGETLARFGPRLFAVPARLLWER